MLSIQGRIIDPHSRSIFEGSLHIEQGKIIRIERHPTTSTDYICVGLVDAHIHIESSMLTPKEFGRMVAPRGTIGVVTDPHEIANVCGSEGVNFMVEDSKSSPIKIFFTIPSSVPATPFDVAGGAITSQDVEVMACSGLFVGLSEVMNVAGVVGRDSEVIKKLDIARRNSLPIDGHAPLISDSDLTLYAAEGISTDHESSTLQEALKKIEAGLKTIIRWGSAAHNYQALKPLIASHPDQVMFCTDDAHPDQVLEQGHIDKFVREGLADGFDLFDLLRIASINPIEHYNLPLGVLREGDSADFIVVEDLTSFTVKQLYLEGELRYDKYHPTPHNEQTQREVYLNNFNLEQISLEQLQNSVEGRFPLIGIIPNQLITQLRHHHLDRATHNLESIPSADIAKLVYINRYSNSTPQVSYIQGFGITSGALASSVGHDSHNIVAVGCNDKELLDVINTIIQHRGGLAITNQGSTTILPLPIAGIISPLKAPQVARLYKEVDQKAKTLGCPLHAPFMTLSFLSLLVIPEVKIGEKGLFDFTKFNWMG